MSDLPNLSNPEVSRHSLVLGFAYSLTPEGLPGIYNEQIADQLSHVGGPPFFLEDDVKVWFVYGHPEHSPRCRRQLIEAAWAAGWNLEPDRVYDVNKRQKWPWDPTTAQMWCRSKQNWDDYERMGKARLA